MSSLFRFIAPWILLPLLAGCPEPAPKETGDSSIVDTGDGGDTDDTDTDTDGCIEETGDTDDPDTDDSGDSGDTDTDDTDTDDTGTGDTGDTGTIDSRCPSGMSLVDDSVCMDTFEASRPDATSSSAGLDSTEARSVGGVLPWQVADNAAAEAACNAAGKRLCATDEWYTACAGSAGSAYPYGNTYDAATCNGIDTYCDCDPAYEGCFYECGGDFSLAVTGHFPDCANEWGVYDLSGNLWEHVAGGSDMTVRGGAYNCGDSAAFHRCDYVPTTWSPSARGFRCCSDPTPK